MNPPAMKRGGFYNWKHDRKTRLVYLGNNFSGNGFWHQFAKVESPNEVWCEIKAPELDLIEETPAAHQPAKEQQR